MKRDPDFWRCENCGEVSHSLDGFAFSHKGDGTREQAHIGGQEGCKRAASIDYAEAFDLIYQRMLDIQAVAWRAFTDELDDGEWEALPQSVKEGLTGIYASAADGTAHRTYEDCGGVVL